jgi:hypothetical protein
LREQSFQFAPVFQTLAEQRDHFGRHVHATTPALLGEGPDESRMFVSARAGGAVWPNAGFSDFGQATFEGGPKGEKFILKMLLQV